MLAFSGRCVTSPAQLPVIKSPSAYPKKSGAKTGCINLVQEFKAKTLGKPLRTSQEAFGFRKFDERKQVQEHTLRTSAEAHQTESCSASCDSLKLEAADLGL